MLSPSIKVIIVEDESLIRLSLVKTLVNNNIDVIAEAKNGEDLRMKLKIKKPNVILLDLEMPVLNGSKTLDFLTKEHPDIGVIILSCYKDDALIKDLFNRGAKAFVSKEEEIEVLLEAIKRVSIYGIYRDNLPCLLKNSIINEGNSYKLPFSNAELRLIKKLLDPSKHYKQIADELFVAEKTVENQAKGIYHKMNIKSRTEFVAQGIKSGLKFLHNPWERERGGVNNSF